MPIAKVTSESFEQEVLNSEMPVVVDFYADWCGPCHQIAPILAALATEHGEWVRFTKVNVDEEPELARAYRVSTIPAVLLFDSGAPTAWSVGPKPGYVLERELGISRLVKAAKKATGSSDDRGHGTAERRGAVAALRSWWGSQ